MTFKQWLVQFKENADFLGSVAQIVSSDSEFPEAESLFRVDKYISDKLKYEGLLPAFTEAWKQYEDSKAVKEDKKSGR